METQNYLSVYAKSFNWAGFFLPKNILIKCSVLYDSCRTLDNIADQNNSLEKKKEEFIKFKEEFSSKSKKNIIISNMVDLIRSENINSSIVYDLFDGIESDIKANVKIKSYKELLIYCYRVAGTIGILMCIALDCKNKEAKKFATDLGIAMQLTNIIRDVLEDAKMDRRYLPSSITKDILPINILTISEKKNYNVNDYKLIKNALEKLISISEEYEFRDPKTDFDKSFDEQKIFVEKIRFPVPYYQEYLVLIKFF